jgi:hypothetical protein
MKRYLAVVVCTFFLSILPMQLTHALDIPNLPDATKPIPGSQIIPSSTTIRILSHRGEWTAFFSTGGSGEPFFLIAGQLENISGKPLMYVKFQFELLSEDGVVIYRDYGYNRKAEALREEEYESGKKSLAEMKIEPVTSGAQDEFRFFFFKEETPEFFSYRVRFLESR